MARQLTVEEAVAQSWPGCAFDWEGAQKTLAAAMLKSISKGI